MVLVAVVGDLKRWTVARVRISLEVAHPTRIPLAHNEHLSAAVYHLLSKSDDIYANFLHNEGYRHNHRVFKLFTFSGLNGVPRIVENDCFIFQPGVMFWELSSSKDDFINHLQIGVGKSKSIDIAGNVFKILGIDSLVMPSFHTGMVQFNCITPLVACVPADPPRTTHYYVRPEESSRFSEVVRQNLLAKYRVMYGLDSPSTNFHMEFLPNPGRHKQYKMIEYRHNKIIGAFTSFQVTSSEELLKLGYLAGFGHKTSIGCGYTNTFNGR